MEERASEISTGRHVTQHVLDTRHTIACENPRIIAPEDKVMKRKIKPSR